MTGSNEGLTRRGVLVGIAGGAAAAALGPKLFAAPLGKSKVVRVESDKVWSGDRRDPAVVARMVREGLVALTGVARPEDAWARFVAATDRVGLKINLLGRPFVYTAREVTDAVAASLLAAGMKPANLVVWDRYKEHFSSTDYVLGPGAGGVAVEAGGQYDAARAVQSSGGPCPADTLATTRTNVTVSLPVLKDHGGAGVTLALKNIAFGCYKHHGKAHDGDCDPYIAEAYQHYLTVNKVPVIILDATLACYDGGPRPSDRARIWRENALYFATDPVALDVTCRAVIMAKRRLAGLPDRTAKCHHIETARGKGLGIGETGRIEVVTVKA